MPMHDDEVDIDVSIVAALVADQFPPWRGLEITRVTSDATVNAIFRIGAEHAARFPLRAGELDRDPHRLRVEAGSMIELAACCSVPTPRPVAIGRPGPGYAGYWAVQTWLPGAVATPAGLATSPGFADDLAALVRALRSADTRGRSFDRPGRGGRLPDHDAWVAHCLDRSVGLLDTDRAGMLWARLRRLPRTGPDAMCHGDLIPANLLVAGGRLVGVLDGGGFGPADPALDLVCGWHLLDHAPRQRLRAAVGCDDVEWARGAAWALEQALGLVWYYRETNPGMSLLGRTTLGRLLGDLELLTI